jgi:peptidoglycan hydrolase-like protein with peptidoglycan-binding domain
MKQTNPPRGGNQLIKHSPKWASICFVGLLVAVIAAAPSTGAARSRAPEQENGPVRPTQVSLSLAEPAVKQGEVTTITALVKPRRAGRIVFLRRQKDGRFVNLKYALTNQKGIAIFRCSFGTKGKVFLRALVLASADMPAATSVPAVENVDTESPFFLTPAPTLAEGSRGNEVLLLQQRLNALGYWLGTPDGYFGDSTQQAVYAFEKVAGIARTGVVDWQFVNALNNGAVPQPRTTSGDAIEVNLESDLLLIVKNGALQYVLNTSTGGGYTYTEDGVTSVALTPRGVFNISHVVDGLVVDSLGALWRPRYFYEGFAIHGDSYVPPYPVSHGCVRVSNEAIDWIWAENLAPIGLKVWVY